MSINKLFQHSEDLKNKKFLLEPKNQTFQDAGVVSVIEWMQSLENNDSGTGETR